MITASETRAYVIEARRADGSYYQLGDGQPLVILADWSLSPAWILDAWLATCSVHTRDVLRETARIRPCTTYMATDEGVSS